MTRDEACEMREAGAPVCSKQRRGWDVGVRTEPEASDHHGDEVAGVGAPWRQWLCRNIGVATQKREG